MLRKYRITNSKREIFCIEAQNPHEAIENLYKDHRVYIKLSDGKNATHIVELINAKRIHKNYYIVYTDTLERKPKPADYIEPMPKKQLQRIIKEFKAKGGIIAMGEEVDKHLREQNAEAVTINENIILLSSNPGRSAVYEELIHAEQYRQGKNDGTYEKRLLCEIEAQRILIKKKEEYGITDKEDKQTKLALKTYKQEYREFKKKEGK